MSDDICEFMGEGYGEAQLAIRAAREVEQTLERLGGDQELHYMEYWHGSDDRYDDNSYDAGSRWCETTLREILEDMVIYQKEILVKTPPTERYPNGNFYYQRRDAVLDMSEINWLGDVSSMFCDMREGDYGGVWCLCTAAEAKAKQLEDRRKELEHTAAAFAAQCGHKVGTREYVLAAYEALEDVRYERERWNDGETRMEQWAACRFAGVGSDVYFDDLNFENGRYANRMDKLRDVLDWLEEVCPLLMRQMEQEKVASAVDDEDEY